MNKEQVFAELKDKWNLFDMTKEETEKAYYEITGLKNYNEVNIKYYLLDYVLESMFRDGDIDSELAYEIWNDILYSHLLEK